MLQPSDRNTGASGELNIHNDLVEASALRTLIAAVHELSSAHTLVQVMNVVRRAARSLVHADGATFILREGENCYYADEDAISPLWKGKRFPMTDCVSGWAMMNGKTAIIPDIYSDPRVPISAYRVTFVKSLVMVPIRTSSPVAAIGTYWKDHHRATSGEVELLQALANTTSVAMEDIRVHNELESRVQSTARALQSEEHLLELYGRLLEAHDRESRRFARELHDGVAQVLVAAMLNVRKMQNLAPTPEMSEAGEQTLALLKQSVAEIRSIAHLLHPSLLDDLGLGATIRWYAQGFSERNKIPVEVELGDGLEALPINVKTAIFRLIEEALLNIKKHAAASRVTIKLAHRNGKLWLTILNDGKRIPEPVPVGVGIQSMMQRTRQLGGQLTIGATPTGTKVEVVLPQRNSTQP